MADDRGSPKKRRKTKATNNEPEVANGLYDNTGELVATIKAGEPIIVEGYELVPTILVDGSLQLTNTYHKDNRVQARQKAVEEMLDEMKRIQSELLGVEEEIKQLTIKAESLEAQAGDELEHLGLAFGQCFRNSRTKKKRVAEIRCQRQVPVTYHTVVATRSAFLAPGTLTRISWLSKPVSWGKCQGRTRSSVPMSVDADEKEREDDAVEHVEELPLPRLFAVGGADGKPSADMEWYGPWSSGWEAAKEAGSMKTKRSHHTITPLGGFIYAVGGSDNGVNALPTVERYDSTADQWKPVASLPAPVKSHGAAVVGNNLYVCGGTPKGNEQALKTVYKYDPDFDNWTTVAPMLTKRVSLALVSSGDSLFAIGGSDGSNTLATVERYDPATDSWTAIGSLNQKRCELAAVDVDGIMYAMGGSDGKALDVVERYDPAADKWTVVAPLPEARTFVSAAVLGGHIYAIGGKDAKTLNVVEKFDPATGSWSTLSSLTTPRACFGVCVV